MDKSYAPAEIESRWYQQWEESGYFTPSDASEPYCIMLPPPNVTGSLHMGHAFQDTIMDVLTRYHRMRGKATLWQPGMDHAGIATQMVVERQLAAEGSSRHDLGRERFEEAVWNWKETSGGTIQGQMRRLGASVDWQHDRFTMDEGLSAAVRKVFVELYHDGLIYRGKRLVNWDPVLRTALSDLEVLQEDEEGKLWHIRYPRADGRGQVVVATTRPETLLGDTAVAVNPDDERYSALVGLELELPLTGRSIPVIADDYVDREFGSGCVKITPAHDFNDYEIGVRHGLEAINVLNDDATLNDNAPEAYRGMDRFEARTRIVADLEAAGLLERVEKHAMVIPRGDRSGAVIEPYLTDQWYVKIAPLAEPAIKAVEDGEIRFVPENWSKTYFNWMNRIEDWCISRQLWWGHRIPAWYDDQGGIHVGESEQDARRRSGLADDVPLRQDEDVLDTWFSSALWPFTTLGWPEKTRRLEFFYPTSVLVTGFDIIFFWVARMIMMGLRFMGDVPFREVYIHGLIRDAQGQKMSKSKGNVLDPIDLIDGIELDALVDKRTSGLMQPQMAPAIEKATRNEFPDGIPAYGCDALRFTFAALATTGRDIRFDLGRIEGYRNFCNKLWNAARYVLMQTDGHRISPPDELSTTDRWIRQRAGQMVTEVEQGIAAYRLDLAAHSLYEFTWNEYCDWYLELSKPALQSGTEAQQNATRHTLLSVLETLLRTLHPFMPFITEEIWQRVREPLGRAPGTIMLQPWPEAQAQGDEGCIGDVEWMKAVLQGIRRIRSELNLAPAQPLRVELQGGGEMDRQRFEQFESLLASLGKVESFEWVGPDADTSTSAVALVGELKVLIPLAGLVDVKAELQRIEKLMAREQAGLKQSRAKMGNRKFVDNAPEAVVAQERERLADHEANVARLEAQKKQLQSLGD
ncbi:MAG: valine--tRNA ligase [Xanthomonadales bacterium]|nr:valine--tRNA ligase [Xanthomonadales bacterium]